MSRSTHLYLLALITACAALASCTDGAPEAGPEPTQPSATQALSPTTQSVEQKASPEAYVAPRHWRASTVMASGVAWSALYDRETGVVSRLYGAGLEAPGSMGDGAYAASFAEDFLARNIGLLAPGASAWDLVQVSNHLDDGVRSIGYHQHVAGLRVLGGQVSVRFKNDRMFVVASEALANVSAQAPGSIIDEDAAMNAALDWVLEDAAGRAWAEGVDGPFVLRTAAGEDRVVLRATARAFEPLGRWDVFLDAESGERVERRQTMLSESGTLNYNAPVRYAGSARQDYPAARATVGVNSGSTTTSYDGLLFWTGANATVDTGLVGPEARVLNDAGAVATTTLSLSDGGAATWNESSNEHRDAQLSAFVHTMRAKEYARVIAPGLSWLDSQIRVTVNINDVCNAYSDGTDIFFFQSGAGCRNTARLADVVYHEFGHSLHFHAIVPGVGDWEVALSEGLGDYYTATITGDPATARGFEQGSSAPLRHIDPANSEAVWPDDIDNDPHLTGLIIAGALWDMRKELVAKLGEPAGVELSDRLFYHVAQRAADIPAAYIEVLVGDDDDGDLSNGTPNRCEIDAAFARHGLAASSFTINAPSIGQPGANGFLVEALSPCVDAAVTATLEWRLREDPSTQGSVAMTPGADGFSGWIPPQAVGEVIEYRVIVSSGQQFPANPADPYYQLFVGTVAPIYCTDFEVDPAIDGWTHGLTSGTATEGADDWQWGTPLGLSDDPDAAYSPTRVYGNDLGGNQFNGAYQADKVNHALSPVIDVSGYSNVRLQFRRWLSVEDGVYDRATIYSNDMALWQNVATTTATGDLHHIDREWRFHDVDLSATIQNDAVQLRFEIASDGGLEMGGWNLDEVCVVGFLPGLCGDGILDPGEGCDDGAANSDTDPGACRTYCAPAGCGDDIIDPGEACDDGNQADGDYCSADCSTITGDCGDGVTQTTEVCDDGNNADGDYCSADCANITGACGDGSLQGAEVCDDGNTAAGDYCSADCASITGACGDGVVQAGEACDDGNGDNTDGCLDTCQLPECGDGVVQPGEACDDGNQGNNDACLTTCQLAACGDGFVQTDIEECDDANGDNTDRCLDTCALATCGDGFTRAGVEACDDANADNTDGCLDSCDLATCGDGIVQVGVEACDDDNGDNTDDCLDTCALAVCGDGFIHADLEACDDGDALDGDGCSADCEVEPWCGDGVVDPEEACDEGEANTDDGAPGSCQTDCTIAPEQPLEDVGGDVGEDVGEDVGGDVGAEDVSGPVEPEGDTGSMITSDVSSADPDADVSSGDTTSGRADDSAETEEISVGAAEGCGCKVSAAASSSSTSRGQGAALALLFGFLVMVRRRQGR